MKKLMLRVMAWLMAIAMLLPSAGNLLTAYAEEGAHKGSITMSDSTWWTEHQYTLPELLGDVDPDDVESITFSSTTTFSLGYNTTGNGDWKQHDGVSNITVDDIWFGEGNCIKACLSKGDGVEYTINWSVNTATASAPAAKPTEAPKATATPVPTKAPAATTGNSYDITTTKDSWGAHTTAIPAAEFEGFKDGVKITVEFKQEVAEYWNLALHSDSAAGWQNLNEYITNYTSNDWGYIDTFSQGDTKITVELSAKGVEKILSDGMGLLFQTYALDVTKATLASDAAAKPTEAPKATATPKPTATPAPTKAPAETPAKPTATPVPTKAPEITVGDELVVTEKMVKNGVVVIENAKYNTIVVPRDVDADTIRLMNVTAGEVEVESGAVYDVDLYNSTIEELNVTSPVVSGVSRAALLKMIADKVTLSEEILLDFLAHTKAMDAIVNLQPEINTYGTTKVGTVTIGGNVKLSTNGCTVADVKVAAKNAYENLNVELAGYAGAVDVALDRAAEDGYCLTKLNLTNCDITTVAVAGLGGSLNISGNTKADKVEVSNVGTVTVAVDAAELTVDKKTENANIRVYGAVDTLNVAGKKNDIVLASDAEIKNANVTGDAIRVYGYGKLENAEVTGSEANVAVPGALVNGANDETTPAEMKEMSPWKALLEKQNGKEIEWEEEEPEEEEPVDLNKTYTLSALPVSGYGYTVDDATGVITFNKQYQEIRYALPEALTVGDYTSVTVNIISTEGGTVAVKLLDASDAQIAVKYGQTGAFTWDFADIDATASIAKVAFMANDAASSVELSTVVFEAKPVADDEEDEAIKVTVELDTEYVGQYNAGNPIPVSAFDGMTGPVTVTLEYELLAEGNYQCWHKPFYEDANWTWTFLVFENAIEGDGLRIEGNTDWGGFVYLDEGTTTQTFTITAEGVEAIKNSQNGLKFAVQDVILKKATLVCEPVEEEEEPEIHTVEATLDTEYVGQYNAGNPIPKTAFAEFAGPVTVTLEYELLAEGNYQCWHKPFYEDANWTWTFLVFENAIEGDGLRIEGNTDWGGFVYLDEGTATQTFTITAEGVEAIKNSQNGLKFAVQDVILKKATLTGTKAE